MFSLVDLKKEFRAPERFFTIKIFTGIDNQ